MIVTWLGDTGLCVNAAQKTVLIDPSFVTSDPHGRVRYPPLPFDHPSMLPPADVVIFGEGADESALTKLRHAAVLRAGETLSESFGDVSVSSIGAGIIVIEGDGVRLLHVTGRLPTEREVGPVDLAFLPFEARAGTPAEGLTRFLDALERLQPSEAAPFGSGWAWLDDARRAQNWARRLSRTQLLGKALEPAHRLGTHLLLFHPGDQWSPDTGVINKALSDGWDDDLASMARYATSRMR